MKVTIENIESLSLPKNEPKYPYLAIIDKKYSYTTALIILVLGNGRNTTMRKGMVLRSENYTIGLIEDDWDIKQFNVLPPDKKVTLSNESKNTK